jgi:putative glutamine amidotransferase
LFGPNAVPVRPGATFAFNTPKVAFAYFGGGEDIHPSMYGCKNVASSCGSGRSFRDTYEAEWFTKLVADGIPMVGVCRGAQFLCAMNGGRLVQHVDNHGGMHPIHFFDGTVLPITSTHHQMMYPWDVPHDLLAWTTKRGSVYKHDIPNYVQQDKDPEIVYFPTGRSLAIQGHPEWMDPKGKTVQAIHRLIREHLNINL